jgi:hypothetical protein
LIFFARFSVKKTHVKLASSNTKQGTDERRETSQRQKGGSRESHQKCDQGPSGALGGNVELHPHAIMLVVALLSDPGVKAKLMKKQRPWLKSLVEQLTAQPPQPQRRQRMAEDNAATTTGCLVKPAPLS